MITFEQLSFYEILGDFHYVRLMKNQGYGYTLILENEDDEEIGEVDVCPAAIDNLASFCERFLQQYKERKENE